MIYELYEADTPYEWVLEWYIRVSAYQLTFIFLRNFIFKKLRSKHLSSSSSAESFFFLPSKILKLHRIDRTYATFHPSQKKKIFDWKKNVKPWYPDFPRFEIIIVAKKWFFDDEATQWRIASLLNPSNDRLRLKKKEKKFFFKSSSSTIWNNKSNVALSQINKRSF